MTATALEPLVRPGIFLGVFLIMAIWEVVAPCRDLVRPKLTRWSNNLGLFLVDVAVVRIVLPMTVVAYAIWIESLDIGLLNWLDAPLWLALPLAVIALDLVIYWQHVAFHMIPVFWRFHRLHHADTDFDVTTALRFHPVEILLSVVVKVVAVTILGAPALAVLVFEVILNACAQFTHGNIRLPAKVDAALRTLFVTPDMHRVHHSVHIEETNSNYGFNLSIWDKLFKTYIPQPRDGQTGMAIGLHEFRNDREMWLDRLLTHPFRKSAP